MATWDYLIVGAGIAGLCLAEALSRKAKPSVLVLDAGRVGVGASSRNAARLTHAGCVTPQLAELARDSRQAINALRRRLGVTAMLQALGEVTVLYREQEIEQFKTQVLPALRHAGLEGALIPATQISERVRGGAFEQAIGAFVTPETVVMHPEGFIFPLQRELAKRGVVIREQTAFKEFVYQGKQVTGVLGWDETWSAKNVIVCSGSDGSDMVAGAGWVTPVKVVRQQVIVTEPVRNLGWPVIRWTGPVGSGQCHRTLRGELIGAAQHPRGEVIRNNQGSGTFMTRTAREFFEHLPVVCDAKILRQWGGQTTLTADHMPFAGPVPAHSGLWALYGMNSFTMYPLFADLLSEALLEHASPSLLQYSALSAARGVRPVE